MHIYAFANQKGGVGKTTLSMHMAVAAMQRNCQTLLVDLDQQGSSTYLYTGDAKYHRSAAMVSGEVRSALDLWTPAREIQPLTESARGFTFDFLPAHAGLDRVDDDLDAGVQALQRLRSLDYDVIILDCPPAPSVRQLAPLIVADVHVIPVTPDALGTQGISQALQLFQKQIRMRNPHLELQILINRLKANSRTNRIIADALAERLGKRVLPYVLYEREDVRKGLNEGKAYWQICKDSQREEWEGAFESLLEGVASTEDLVDAAEELVEVAKTEEAAEEISS
ncbi:ParA family protein [Acidithiobacillus thiooxidans]|uniref:ParA family protein n=1 Tax=Acidithiobacillus thiooxidans TaxID=930 RepID=UPI00068F2A49|nr:ParA family protein [Acidithiobacillus thiooxidans]MBU2837403.1 ParA family protein [Acidithiobacillus thiooxidans]